MSALVLLLAAAPALAASSPVATADPAPLTAGVATTVAAAQEPADEAFETDPAEPDFEVVNLPTNLRLPRHKLTFRLTHRFARPLGEGSFSDLAADLFGFDGGAQIGLGLRFGVLTRTQLGIYRTSDRTIVWDAQQSLLREPAAPLSLSLRASVEGLNNFGLSAPPEPPTLHEFSPSLALVLSRKLGDRVAFYVVPSWTGNTRILTSAPAGDDDTFVLGLGARLRLTGAVSLVGEIHPRLAGYAGDVGSGDADALATFGVEGRVGGHAFQINFSNGLGTTPAQVARGADPAQDWFIGFNLTRKFY